jgi:hypothetical protein
MDLYLATGLTAMNREGSVLFNYTVNCYEHVVLMNNEQSRSTQN